MMSSRYLRPATLVTSCSAVEVTGIVPGSDDLRRRDREMQVGGDADAHLGRAVDVARQRRRAGNREQPLGAREPARLGVVDRQHLRGVEAHDFEHVLGGPGALVGHHRHVDALADLGHGAQALDRLLGIDQIVFLHRGDRPHRLAPGAVALVGVDPDLAGAADRLAHRRHDLDVALDLDADLDLDGGDAFGHDLGGFARGGVRVHDADAVREFGAVAHLAAEQLIDRHAVDLADRVVQRHVDRRLGVGIAAQHAVHAQMQLLDLGDVLPGDGRKQHLLDRHRGHLRRLAVARAVVAAPGADHLRFAPADDAVLELEPQDRVAFADAAPYGRPSGAAGGSAARSG